MDKLRVGWGIRARKFEERIRTSEERLIKLCWMKKEARLVQGKICTREKE